MTPSVAPTDKVFCGSSQPIYWSKSDTDKTIEQVKEHNAAWKALCQKQTPAKRQSAGITFKERWFEGVKLQVTAFR